MLFSIRVKELFEPIPLRKKWQVFALFKSIFLINQSLSNASWFKVKNTKLGREILIYLKIDEVKTKCGVEQISQW